MGISPGRTRPCTHRPEREQPINTLQSAALHGTRSGRTSLKKCVFTQSCYSNPSKKLGKSHKTHFQHNITTSGSSEGNEMIKSMRSYVLFCICDDIVTLAGCVIINILSCYLNYFLDVTGLF